jgi:hypothetical protein
MAETVRDSANPPAAHHLPPQGAGGHKIRRRWPEPPSGRANWIVTRTYMPFAALKWVAVGLGVLALLVIVPLVDLVGGTLLRLGRLVRSAPVSRR